MYFILRDSSNPYNDNYVVDKEFNTIIEVRSYYNLYNPGCFINSVEFFVINGISYYFIDYPKCKNTMNLTIEQRKVINNFILKKKLECILS